MFFVMVSRRYAFFITVLTLSALQHAWVQENHEERRIPKPNISVMHDRIQFITGIIIDSVHLGSGDSIAVQVQRHAASQIADQAITAALINRKLTVFSAGDSAVPRKYLLHVPSAQLQVQYANMFKDGIFGTKLAERTITVQLSSQLKNQITNEILYSGTLSQNSTDTVSVDDIESLEDETIKVSQGEMPSETFLDRFIEPFVIVGATGVAIYLLFHIRS